MKSLSSENTRSHAAEVGVNAKTMRAARDHSGNLVPCDAQNLRTFAVNSCTSVVVVDSEVGRGGEVGGQLRLERVELDVLQERRDRAQLVDEGVVHLT